MCRAFTGEEYPLSKRSMNPTCCCREDNHASEVHKHAYFAATTSSTNVNISWLHHSSYFITPSTSGRYQNKAKSFNVSKSLEFFRTLFCSSPSLSCHHPKDTKQQRICTRIYGVPETNDQRSHALLFCLSFTQSAPPKLRNTKRFTTWTLMFQSPLLADCMFLSPSAFPLSPPQKLRNTKKYATWNMMSPRQCKQLACFSLLPLLYPLFCDCKMI
jgi:hypothetical protein